MERSRNGVARWAIDMPNWACFFVAKLALSVGRVCGFCAGFRILSFFVRFCIINDINTFVRGTCEMPCKKRNVLKETDA